MWSLSHDIVPLIQEEMPRREESSWVCARCVRCGVCGDGLEVAGDALTDRSAVDPDPEKSLVFGPQMALAYRLDVILQGPKISRFPGPNQKH